MRRGVVELPLHWGAAPRWLFNRMCRLSRAILELMVAEYGPDEVILRLADPFWFQSLGCLLGFDWHSSGLTTTLCAALKEATRGDESQLGILIAGGKGRRSRRTPEEIRSYGERFSIPNSDQLVYTSRIVAKVDSAGLQDGYQLYHHMIFFTPSGRWAVVQQGMNPEIRFARRYHWCSEGLADFVVEPHHAILCDRKGLALNMVAQEGERAREVSVEVARGHPDKVVAELKKIRELSLPARHPITAADISPERIGKILSTTCENLPQDFEALLARPGVGPKTIRALALIAELTYGAQPSFRDPVSYSFAHGGKDGYPYPVDRREYDRSISTLKRAIRSARLGRDEELSTLRRLARFFPQA